jgi:hypothetical protein
MNINVFNLPGKRKHFGDKILRALSGHLSMQDYRQDYKNPRLGVKRGSSQ